MPIILQKRLTKLQEQRITRMTLTELITYEAVLWRWMDKLDKSKMHSEDIVVQLNAIHREVEWRAMDAEWNHAAHP
jgi:hypothetical protein